MPQRQRSPPACLPPLAALLRSHHPFMKGSSSARPKLGAFSVRTADRGRFRLWGLRTIVAAVDMRADRATGVPSRGHPHSGLSTAAPATAAAAHATHLTTAVSARRIPAPLGAPVLRRFGAWRVSGKARARLCTRTIREASAASPSRRRGYLLRDRAGLEGGGPAVGGDKFRRAPVGGVRSAAVARPHQAAHADRCGRPGQDPAGAADRRRGPGFVRQAGPSGASGAPQVSLPPEVSYQSDWS